MLATPAGGDIENASQAVDGRGWPRWAVVAASPVPPPVDSHAVHVPAADWTEPVLAVALASAVRLRELKAAHALLEGDIRTISRRLGHDVRSPLNCISTAGEAMKDPDEPADSPRSVFAHSIANSVDEIVRLVERVSFILKATTSPPAPQPVVMEEIVWGALQRLESRVAQAGAAVHKPLKWPVV
jgi:signal transduction histidine kinase